MLYQTEEEYCAVYRFTAQFEASISTDMPITDYKSIDKLGQLLEGLSIRKGKAVS